MKKTLVFALTTLLIALSCGKAEKGSKSSEEKPAAPPADVVTVDLGLSVLWADRNIGAQNVEDFGDAFAWGEGWRMPTKQEMIDLFKLEHENVTENGEFYIWTSERTATLVTFAHYGGNYSIANCRREYAHYVRPVKSK